MSLTSITLVDTIYDYKFVNNCLYKIMVKINTFLICGFFYAAAGHSRGRAETDHSHGSSSTRSFCIRGKAVHAT